MEVLHDDQVFLQELTPAAPEILTDLEIDARVAEFAEYLDTNVLPEHREALATIATPKSPQGNDNPNSKHTYS